MDNTATSSCGKVYFVGAGPGDPALITLRGVACLERADVVLYDYLVNPRILAIAGSRAETICLGQSGRARIWSQEEISARIVELARQGKTVVRLKSGDPAVFARGAEEIEPLVQAEIPFEIVPGITAALAAGSYAGIPVTHRGLASAVALVTGQEDDGKESAALDYATLARFPGTLVFYMGVTTAPKWTAALMAGGKAPETPAAIIRRCSCPDQTVICCTLGEVAERLQRSQIEPPVIIILGQVARLAPLLGWFEKRPLFGRCIMVTRPEGQASKLSDLLEDLGAHVLTQPAIKIGPPADWTRVDQALERLSDFDWLVFSSSNGVRFLLDRLLSTGRDVRALSSVRLAVIGPGTAGELTRYSLRADLQPGSYRAESLAAALSHDAGTKRFLLARASRGREVLAEQLRRAGATVEEIVAYESTDCQEADPDIASLLAGGHIDYVTVTSSAIARSLAQLFGERLRRSKLVSISPVTTDALRQLGFQPAAEAETYTMQGVVSAILRDAARHPSGEKSTSV